MTVAEAKPGQVIALRPSGNLHILRLPDDYCVVISVNGFNTIMPFQFLYRTAAFLATDYELIEEFTP